MIECHHSLTFVSQTHVPHSLSITYKTMLDELFGGLYVDGRNFEVGLMIQKM